MDILNFLLIIICCIIGNIIANLISNYFVSKSLKKSIFSKNDFINVDDDFFSDDSKSSITDIDSSNSNSTNINDNKLENPKFF